MPNETPHVMRLDMVLSEDRLKLTLTLLMDGVPLGHIILEAPDVEDAIHNLAAARSSMADQVPTEIEPSARILALDNPLWRTKIPTQSPKPGILLALRHPGLGWIVSLLPKEEASKLSQSLSDRLHEL